MTNPQTILLVDDDPDLLKLLSIRLSSAGYSVATADSGSSALNMLSRLQPALVISDLRMQPMDGMSLLIELHRQYPALPVIMLTAHGTIPDAVHATQQGVFGFLTKPIEKDELLAMVAHALRNGSSTAINEEWQAEIVTRNPVMLNLLAQVKMVAQVDSSIMITGPSGSGKELIARALHRVSSRATEPFVALNCGALPENLLEAELFGYMRGAFTGALRNHNGLFQAADGGSLFLDEIGDMPTHLQIKLLRVLQERKLRPLGGTQDIAIDVRIISATHRNVKAMITAGTFREDLYYRLNVVSLEVPSLAQRREDIPLLVQHMLNRLARRPQGQHKVYAPEAMELLVQADWPGNVRQLQNIVEQNVTLTPGAVISAAIVEKALGTISSGMPSFDQARDEFTRNYLSQLLYIAEGSVSQAAKLAQRNRTDFYKLLNKYHLKPEQFKNNL